MWRREDEIQTLLRESAEAHLTQTHSPERFRRCRETDAGFDAAFWKSMGQLGWTGILLPESAGGSAIGLGAALALAETFGQQLVPEPFIASTIIAATLLGRSDSERAADLSAKLAEGDIVILLADQETAGEVSPALPSASLTREGETFVLSGSKGFVPSWSSDAYLLVTATVDGEPCVVVVGPGQAGVEVSTNRMSDGTVSADIIFKNVTLQQDAVLLTGATATEATQLAVANGTIALSAQLEGLARQLHKLTCDYVVQRVQFGHPIANFQALRHALANLGVDIDLAGSAWRYAATAAEKDLSDQTLIRISSAKARCSDCALAVARAAIQFHGAFGYTEEADVGLYVNSALRWSSWLGNAHFHRSKALRLHRRAADA